MWRSFLSIFVIVVKLTVELTISTCCAHKNFHKMNRSYPTTSQKQRDFMEPMGNKLVTKLPGIGETLGDRLSNSGYQKASQVYGQYLALDQNRQDFNHFMKDTCNANSKQSSDCYNTLNDWTKEFL